MPADSRHAYGPRPSRHWARHQQSRAARPRRASPLIIAMATGAEAGAVTSPGRRGGVEAPATRGQCGQPSSTPARQEMNRWPNHARSMKDDVPSVGSPASAISRHRVVRPAGVRLVGNRNRRPLSAAPGALICEAWGGSAGRDRNALTPQNRRRSLHVRNGEWAQRPEPCRRSVAVARAATPRWPFLVDGDRGPQIAAGRQYLAGIQSPRARRILVVSQRGQGRCACPQSFRGYVRSGAKT